MHFEFVEEGVLNFEVKSIKTVMGYNVTSQRARGVGNEIETMKSRGHADHSISCQETRQG